MDYRLFIASRPSEDLRNFLADFQKKNFPRHSCRWAPAEALHLTWVFIGETAEDKLDAVNRACQETAASFSPWSLHLNEICYGPNPNSPRFIWAQGQSSAALDDLYRVLCKKLAENKIDVPFSRRSFLPHITLARLDDSRIFSPAPHPWPIDQSFPVQEISVVRSELDHNQNWPLYTDLNIHPFSLPCSSSKQSL